MPTTSTNCTDQLHHTQHCELLTFDVLALVSLLCCGMLRCVDWQLVSEVSDVSREAKGLHIQDQAGQNYRNTAVQDFGRVRWCRYNM